MPGSPLPEPRLLGFVRAAEDAWNMRDLDRLLYGSSIDCQWRIKSEFLWGREQIRNFLHRRWRKEIEFRTQSELWAHRDRRIAIRFSSEFRDENGTWVRTFGNENWELDDNALVRRRLTSANSFAIESHERLLLWSSGKRPDDHPSLSELGL